MRKSGKSSPRMSRSHMKSDLSNDFHDPNACPESPVTAIILSQNGHICNRFSKGSYSHVYFQKNGKEGSSVTVAINSDVNWNCAPVSTRLDRKVGDFFSSALLEFTWLIVKRDCRNLPRSIWC
jgi:hypothetical protein